MLWKIITFIFLCNSAFAGVEGNIPSSASAFLERRLRNNGFPEEFIAELLNNYDVSKRDQVIKLNVMGFLLSPDYGGHISPSGIQHCREFLNEHAAAFAAAENKYGVKKELIASLLWVESRLGENHGGFHVASVYLSLLQGEHSEVTNMLLDDLKKKLAKSPPKAMVQKTKDRAKKKVKWAIEELWSLYKMNKKQPNTVAQLKGSYSGAFGYPQFLPSSYVQWAQSFSKKRAPDLYTPNDAIMSVGYYLRKNGYKRGKASSYKKALYRYNKSYDYGNTILKLATNL